MSSPTASLPAVPAGVRTGRFRLSGYQALALLSAAHFFIDWYSSALSSFQPLLGKKFGLSLAQAGMLGGALVFSSSLLQPLYGVLSDRYRTRLFTVLAPAVAGVFISCLGVARNFEMLLAMVVLGGAGIASFHPQASANAIVGLGGAKARSMAIFISSGTLGMSLGPAFFSWLTATQGMEMSWIGAIPGVLATGALAALWRLERAEGAAQSNGFAPAPLLEKWKPLGTLFLLVFIRSMVQMVFAQFLPLYLHRERGFGVQAAAAGLTIYLASGAVGGFVGGNLADRLGGKKVILLSMAGCLPFLAGFFLTSGWAAMAFLGLAGLMLLFTIPVNLVMGQQLVPAQAGTVSSLMMGFAWGSAGLVFIPLTGYAADHFGLGTAMAAVSVAPALGFLLALTIREEDHR